MTFSVAQRLKATAVSLAMTATWLVLLYLALWQGSEGAGNVIKLWTWMGGALLVVGLLVSDKAKASAKSYIPRFINRSIALGSFVALAWYGWLFTAFMYAIYLACAAIYRASEQPSEQRAAA